MAHTPVRRKLPDLKVHGVGMKVQCPVCGSENTYWRTETRTWICRKFGHVFDANFKPFRKRRRAMAQRRK
jgi:ribosomal protein L37AE/L43A